MDTYNSIVARILGRINKSDTWAVTVNSKATWYSHAEWFVDERPAWRRHEDKHKEQIRIDGLKFYFKYFWQYLTKGYGNIDYEIEARQAE